MHDIVDQLSKAVNRLWVLSDAFDTTGNHKVSGELGDIAAVIGIAADDVRDESLRVVKDAVQASARSTDNMMGALFASCGVEWK